VTAAAVIGSYFAADGLQASGFTAVFVFGIVLGNQNYFGFKMRAGEAKRLEEFVMTTAFIMRLAGKLNLMANGSHRDTH
jgi:potassium/hydrogen antiporter